MGAFSKIFWTTAVIGNDKACLMILLQPFLHRNQKRLFSLDNYELIAHGVESFGWGYHLIRFTLSNVRQTPSYSQARGDFGALRIANTPAYKKAPREN